MKTSPRVNLMCIVAFTVLFLTTSESFNHIGTCLRNCAQCTKMLGPYFEGALCADTCVKLKGKIIPDCEDANSIEPFITRPDDD
ncbi:eclosion hormone isoform X2 [Belonocnema kinseyi]|nr:eclosion hormone isoform X2 [Belonocnema kinseyi]XP_033226441.1 eclosion hormone isoform X2 [Belonocnema kinseyi]XP_033226442.1 eclosion hormone isoform X2 [Belonocnema kinseyi]